MHPPRKRTSPKYSISSISIENGIFCVKMSLQPYWIYSGRDLKSSIDQSAYHFILFYFIFFSLYESCQLSHDYWRVFFLIPLVVANSVMNSKRPPFLQKLHLRACCVLAYTISINNFSLCLRYQSDATKCGHFRSFHVSHRFFFFVALYIAILESLFFLLPFFARMICFSSSLFFVHSSDVMSSRLVQCTLHQRLKISESIIRFVHLNQCFYEEIFLTFHGPKLIWLKFSTSLNCHAFVYFLKLPHFNLCIGFIFLLLSYVC